MSDIPDSRPNERRIDAAAKSAFLAALSRGDRREDAAAEAGFSLTGFYGARRRDPAFGAGWAEALAEPPAAERRAKAYEERGEVRIASANRRFCQRRRRRHVRFTAERRDSFLAHFATSCDTTAAAAAAGVHESTVHLHRRTDPAFAEAYEEALQQGYIFLEAEALRLRLEAQKRYRAAIENAQAPPRNGEGDRRAERGAGGGPPLGPKPCPTCGRIEEEDDAEFDRVMKLLARHDRKPRRVERGFIPGGRRRRWTFDEAIALLDRKLRAMGVRYGPIPPKVLEDYPEERDGGGESD